MPEDLPRAVLILVWLLSGTIIFGWILMQHTVLGAVLFALVFFAIPVAVYQWRKQKRPDAE